MFTSNLVYLEHVVSLILTWCTTLMLSTKERSGPPPSAVL